MKEVIYVIAFAFGVIAFAQGKSMVIAPPNQKHSGCDLSVHGFKSRTEFEAVFANMKNAAVQKDPEAISNFIIYPLRVNQKSNPMTIANEAELKKGFSTIFSDKVLRAISAQKIEELFCNYQGAMIGDGEVWIKQVKDKIGIATINK